ncbi:hypothetical protein MWH28_05455 [Natroniella sulfidigena]|uniref:hypothetical protein n=1 Tax=Natroniella sulfidigena TaxID=723921 RepID=UPI00200A334B|nr:hypothetical protein [Natroniella sulfidigena]MCK8816817.1 hypothetical protein [Natroniella sulfidigena]
MTSFKLNQNIAEQFKLLIDDLEEVIVDTEDYYQLIYETLPEIEQNIELNRQEIAILIDYFINIEEVDAIKDLDLEGRDLESNLVSKTLAEIKKNLKEIDRLLLDQEQMDQILSLFLTTEDGRGSFSDLLELMGDIKMILEDVELISLNAIIFASKLEEDGTGFRVVSNNIHQISSVLRNEFEKITAILSQLSNWHQNFQASVTEIINRQEEVVKEQVGQVDNVFLKVRESLQTVNQILRDLMDNVTEVVAPVQDLMVQIQSQDLIRQNFENLIKSLQLIANKYQVYLELGQQNPSLERLDYIVFVRKGLELLEQLSINTFDELFMSVDQIVEGMDSLLDSLAEVEDDAQNLAEYFSVGDLVDQQEHGMIDVTFETVHNFTVGIVKSLVEIDQFVDKLSGDKKLFNDNFFKLGNSIKKVAGQVNRLNRVELLARIELARIEQRDSGVGEQIEDVVTEVVETVEQNNKLFYELKDELLTDIDEFDRIIVDNQTQINQAATEVEDSLEQLEMTNEIINQAVLALSDEIKNLKEELFEISKKIKSTESLKNKGAEVINFLQRIINLAIEEEDKNLAMLGKDSWEINDEQLQELVAQFTTYLERDVAQEFFATEDEGNSAAGELTLF